MQAMGMVFAVVCAAAAMALSRLNRGEEEEEAPPPPEVELTETAAIDVPSDGYNVILIVVDSLRYDHLGTYGYRRDTTPNIDRFAAGAVVFEDFISQCSWTLPSHATMFTGLYPSAHGVDHNFERIAEDATTLAWVLQQAGYRTLGYSCAPLLELPYGIQRGFDEYDDTLSRKAKKKTWMTVTSEKMVDRALDGVEDADDERFFLYMHMWDVHYDYNPPAPHDTRYDPDYTGDYDPFHWVKDREKRPVPPPEDRDHIVALYDGEVSWTDHNLGRFFDELEEMGRLDDTVVIVTADHGEEFWDHGLTCHNHSNYEEQVHVPFILHAPGMEAQTRIPCRSAMVDLYPTVLDLAGVAYPDDVPLQGQSLLPLIRGERACDPQREILTETVWSRHGTALRGKKAYELAMYRGRYKVSRRIERPYQDFLFDLVDDPAELDNLAEEEHELFLEMSERMSELAAENAAIHDLVNFSAHKKMDQDVVDTLRALGYVDD
jgi:arylsulfatase A-like enzyme